MTKTNRNIIYKNFYRHLYLVANMLYSVCIK